MNLPQLWLGDELSLHQFLLRHEKEPPPQLYASVFDPEDDDDEEDPYEMQAARMVERYGNVGVLNIKGSLVNEDSLFNDWFGDISYASIQRALGQLLEDDSISTILMDIATHGGDAAGIDNAANAILDAREVKPIYAWADPAHSAGYWLAAAAQEVYSSKMGSTGSIGAISTAVSQVERLKQAGIEVFVARSAPKKVLNHPAEPISEEGKASLMAKVDELGGFFIDFVVRQRPNLSASDPKASWASGETFFGGQALAFGLIDGLKSSASSLISELQEVHTPTQSSGAPPMSKRIVLSSIDQARVAAGIPLTELATPNGDGISSSEDPQTPGEEDAGASPEATAPSPAPAIEGAAAPTPASMTSSSGGDLTAYLKDQLAELKAENKALKDQLVESATAQVALSAKAAEVDHLRPVAEAAVSRLSIGLGHRPTKLEHVPSDLLAEQFEELQAELMALPAGRQSVEPQVDAIEADDEGPETLAQHRLRLVPGAR